MKKLARVILGLLLLAAFPAGVFAQEGMVKGVVYDVDGSPMPGVSVVVPGTSSGVVSDMDGKFSIKAAAGSVLEFWYLGYETLTETVSQSSQPLEIRMVLSADVLDDVVVVGYGAVKKSDLTGSVGSVKMEAIADLSASSVDGLLQGRAAGLQVMNTSQDPGSGAIIRIRGNSSINGSNTPLVVVNGFPMGDAGALTQINTSDIASVEVLKDASASAIYGSRGANGVILVTTKNA